MQCDKEISKDGILLGIFPEMTSANPEPKFFNIKENVPEEGQNVVYYFHGKSYVGQYEKCAEPDFGTHCFFGSHGFLTDDVVWWHPVTI